MQRKEKPWVEPTVLMLLGVLIIFLVQLLGGRPGAGAGEAAWMTAAFLALLVIMIGGVIALTRLIAHPLKSRAGRWATGLAVINVAFFPLIITVQAVIDLLGFKPPSGWPEPLVPIWILTGAGAVVLGVWSKEERGQGVLLIPVMFSAAVLSFFLGDLIVPAWA